MVQLALSIAAFLFLAWVGINVLVIACGMFIWVVSQKWFPKLFCAAVMALIILMVLNR
jgi:hypothetical protein